MDVLISLAAGRRSILSRQQQPAAEPLTLVPPLIHFTRRVATSRGWAVLRIVAVLVIWSGLGLLAAGILAHF